VLDSVIVLLQTYWLYVLGALVLGLGIGWFSYRARK